MILKSQTYNFHRLDLTRQGGFIVTVCPRPRAIAANVLFGLFTSYRDARGTSASLIGRLGSNTFRLSTTAVSMSLTGTAARCNVNVADGSFSTDPARFVYRLMSASPRERPKMANCWGPETRLRSTAEV